jgi:hypothetical protein
MRGRHYFAKRALNNLDDLTAKIAAMQEFLPYEDRLRGSTYGRLVEEADMWAQVVKNLGHADYATEGTRTR